MLKNNQKVSVQHNEILLFAAFLIIYKIGLFHVFPLVFAKTCESLEIVAVR